MNEFFITLLSNTSSENKTGDFIVHLPGTIELEGNWEVALTDIIYPRSWMNLTSYIEKDTGQSSNSISLVFQDGEILVINVPPAHFDTINELLSAIDGAIKQAGSDYNIRSRVKRSLEDDEILQAAKQGHEQSRLDAEARQAVLQSKAAEAARQEAAAEEVRNNETESARKKVLEVLRKSEELARARAAKEEKLAALKLQKIEQISELSKKMYFVFNPLLKRVTIHFDSSLISQVHLSTHLQHMLGFESRFLIVNKEEGKYNPDMKAGIEALYLYVDIIEPQRVGTGFFNLLRVIHIDNSEFNSTVEKIYYAPQYLSVAQKILSFIHVEVKTDTGVLVPFQSGKIVCKLHFRRKRILLE